MNSIQLHEYELTALENFVKRFHCIELSPKNIDEELGIGREKIIDLFLDLELKGCIEWIHLNLLNLNLDRSTNSIYEEVYTSTAQITKKGKSLVENHKSQKAAAWQVEITGKADTSA